MAFANKIITSKEYFVKQRLHLQIIILNKNGMTTLLWNVAQKANNLTKLIDMAL